MKILVIANSFGTDAVRYLYGIARAAEEKIKVVNLYIGGCSLYRHYRNMLSEEKAYSYELNGMTSGLFVSMKEALLSDEWDTVVMQQSSPLSGCPETYEPYLSELSAYVKKMAPAAKQYLQETWTYDPANKYFLTMPYHTREEMIPAVKSAYREAAKRIGATGLIPSMDAMRKLYDEKGGDVTYRDKHHASLGIGRYLLGCVWFMTLFGKDLEGNPFRDFDEPVSEEDVLVAQRLAREAVLENGIFLN